MPQAIRTTSAARAAVFAPLVSAGKAELVAQRLTDAIELGLLTHGERLPSEAEMGRLFGVATVTAREALEALRVAGLVETKRGRDGGSFVLADGRESRIMRRVASLSRVELRDMGVYYTAIAAMSAELAADRATDDDIAHLLAVVASTDTQSESSTRRAEGTFRLEVAALAQSARLVREELRLQGESAPLVWLCLREPEHRARSVVAHRGVIDAIAAGDGGGARDRTTAHLGEAIEWLLETKARLERSAP